MTVGGLGPKQPDLRNDSEVVAPAEGELLIDVRSKAPSLAWVLFRGQNLL